MSNASQHDSVIPAALCSWLVLMFICFVRPAAGLDRVVFQRDQQRRTIEGKLLVTARDGGLLILTADGVLWAIQPDEIAEHTTNERTFRPLTADELANQLLAELPPGFDIHKSRRYVILHNTSRVYARWCGALLERLHGTFMNFWRRRGFKLHDPQLPLVAIVFSDAHSYREYAQAELGEAADSIIGFYSLRTNRVTMYDLTGLQALRNRGARRGTTAEINQMLSRPEAEPLVSTVIHEATHQIAFNCGLMTRYADIPLWLSEGIAIYFETPDLKSTSGWRGISKVNRPRLATFRNNILHQTPGSLVQLIVDDQRMRGVRTAVDAYAEAWALNYFLIRNRPDAFLDYLKMLSEKKQLVWDDPQTRLSEFKKFFGHDLERLDADFVRHMKQVRE